MANPENQTVTWVKLAIDCYNAIRRRRWIIIAVTVLTVFIASIREITLPAYGADTLIAVTPLAAVGNVAQSVPETFEPKTYEQLLQSMTVMGLVLERLADEGRFDEGDVPPVDEFSRDLWLDIDMVDQTTRPVTYSPIIRLNAKANTPDMVIAILQTWADVAIEVGNGALVAQVDSAAENLSGQRSNFESILETVREELREEKANWNLDIIRREIELNQSRLDLLTQAHQIAQQDAEAARAQLDGVETQLASEKPFREYRKAPSDDAYFITKGNDRRASADGNGDSLASEVMVTQEENLVYTLLKTQEHEFRAREAEAASKLSSIDQQMETAIENLGTEEAALAEHEMNQARLEADVAIAQTVYDDIATASSFSAAAQVLAGRVGDDGRSAIGLNRVSDRIFPVRFDGIFGSRLTVIVAMLTGFVLIVSFVLVREVGIPLLQDFVGKQTEE